MKLFHHYKAENLLLISFITFLIFISYLPSIPLFRSSNFETYLASILGAYKSDFLSRDFFVKANQGFGPRYYYAKLLGLFFLKNQVAVPYYLINFLIVFLECLATLFLCKTLFANKKSVFILALIFLFLIPGPIIGLHGKFPINIGNSPMEIALIFLVFSLTAILNKRNYLCLFFLILSSLLHPNIGIIHGSIILFSALIAQIINSKNKIESSLNLKRIIFVSFIFIIVNLVSWIIPLCFQKGIASSDLVKILAYSRAPHHLLLGLTNKKDIYNLLFFIFSTIFILVTWIKLYKIEKYIWVIIFLTLISIPPIFLVGYYFIEIYPSKIGVMLYPARYNELLRYLGLVLAAGVVVKCFEEKNGFLFGIFLILAIIHSYFHLLIISCVFFIICLFNNFNLKTIKKYYLYIFTIISVLTIYKFNFESRIIILSLIIVSSLYLLSKRRLIPNIFLILVFIGLIFGVGTSGKFYPNHIKKWFQKHNLIANISFDVKNTYTGQAANFAFNNTAEDSLFLTPPLFGHFRILAKRAILVDFKSIPFQDVGILEWANRFEDAYGSSQHRGFRKAFIGDKKYRQITRENLEKLKLKYGINYALLYSQTRTDYKIIYENRKYKIVEINKNI